MSEEELEQDENSDVGSDLGNEAVAESEINDFEQNGLLLKIATNSASVTVGFPELICALLYLLTKPF